MLPAAPSPPACQVQLTASEPSLVPQLLDVSNKPVPQNLRLQSSLRTSSPTCCNFEVSICRPGLKHLSHSRSLTVLSRTSRTGIGPPGLEAGEPEHPVEAVEPGDLRSYAIS